LAALLHVSAHKFFGVLLEDRVDLVEQIVDVLGDLGVPLGNFRVGLGGDVLDFLVATTLSGLRLTAGVSGCHLSPPSLARQHIGMLKTYLAATTKRFTGS
jgi:hypothetical protein